MSETETKAEETQAQDAKQEQPQLPPGAFGFSPPTDIDGANAIFTNPDKTQTWMVVCINLNKFPEKDAVAYLHAQEFPLRQNYTARQNDAMKKIPLSLPAKGNNGGIVPFLRNLGGRKH